MKSFLLLLCIVATTSFAQTNSNYRYTPPVQLNDGLQTASLSDVGIDSDKIIALTNKILSGQYVNIHSLLIFRFNKLVYENYFAGADETIVFGADDRKITRVAATSPLDMPRDSLHDVRSISKSVTSACIGIAIAQGKIKDVNESIWNYFPEYKDLKTGLKSALTIRHLLTMTSGLDMNEIVPYDDSANTERQTNRSPDPIRFILSRQSIYSPGTKWNYSGGCTELLAAIVQKASGLEIDAFAYKYLFAPLGITHFNWVRLPSTATRKGLPAAASGLQLTGRDMVKFGLLYVNGGKWKNKQIIPANWIGESLQYHFTTDYTDTHYGYQFWGGDAHIVKTKYKAFAAMGFGGQNIVVIPSLEVVVVVTAGNYGRNLGQQSYEMIDKEIYPAIKIK